MDNIKASTLVRGTPVVKILNAKASTLVSGTLITK